MIRPTPQPSAGVRADRLVDALQEEIVLPPVRAGLADLASGLERLALVDPTVLMDADAADVLTIAHAVCDADPALAPPRVVHPDGWSGPALQDGPLGPEAVTPAGVAFAASCEAGWLARYCDGRPRGWQELGMISAALAERLSLAAEQLRTEDDDRAEARAETEFGLEPVLIDITDAKPRLERLDEWCTTPSRLAAAAGFRASRPGTIDTLERLGRRLNRSATLLAQLQTVRYSTIRRLAYYDADEEGLAGDVADLWADTQGAAPRPVSPAAAEAAIIMRLRDAALTSLLAATEAMALPVVDHA